MLDVELLCDPGDLAWPAPILRLAPHTPQHPERMAWQRGASPALKALPDELPLFLRRAVECDPTSALKYIQLGERSLNFALCRCNEEEDAKAEHAEGHNMTAQRNDPNPSSTNRPSEQLTYA